MGHFHHKKLCEKSFKEMFLPLLFPLILSKYGKIIIMPKDQRERLTRCVFATQQFSGSVWRPAEWLQKSPSLTALMCYCFSSWIVFVLFQKLQRGTLETYCYGHRELMWPFPPNQPPGTTNLKWF